MDEVCKEIALSYGYYSIGLDETPHMDHSIYAFVIRFICYSICYNFYRYFTKSGIKNRVLKLVEMNSKKAVDITQLIQETLDAFDLDCKRMIAFTADNTMANFGGLNRNGNNNVYAILKQGII